MSLTRFGIAYRIANDLPDGSYVNLGVGIPGLLVNFLPEDKTIFLHSENGILGFGPVIQGSGNPYVRNANEMSVSLIPGASLFDHSLSFAMVRGGHITHAIMGAMQVSAQGDLANWHVPGQKVPGVGGAMDLAANVNNVYIAMTHTTKEGEPKIVSSCTFPLTAERCVTKIYTDLAVINVTDEGLELVEVAPGIAPEEVQRKTAAPLRLAENLKSMDIPDRIDQIQLVNKERS
jgi:3-oxoacid CoA-transferase subunit B